MGNFVPVCPEAGPQALGSTCGDGSNVTELFPQYQLPVLPVCSNNDYDTEGAYGPPTCVGGLCMPSFCYCNSGENSQESYKNSFYKPEVGYYIGELT